MEISTDKCKEISRDICKKIVVDICRKMKMGISKLSSKIFSFSNSTSKKKIFADLTSYMANNIGISKTLAKSPLCSSK